MNEQKIYKLTEKLGNKWVEYCEVKEELRGALNEGPIPDEEKSLKEVTIHIEVLTFNNTEELREINEEQWFGGHRQEKLNLDDIDKAVSYLLKLKEQYK